MRFDRGDAYLALREEEGVEPAFYARVPWAQAFDAGAGADLGDRWGDRKPLKITCIKGIHAGGMGADKD